MLRDGRLDREVACCLTYWDIRPFRHPEQQSCCLYSIRTQSRCSVSPWSCQADVDLQQLGEGRKKMLNDLQHSFWDKLAQAIRREMQFKATQWEMLEEQKWERERERVWSRDNNSIYSSWVQFKIMGKKWCHYQVQKQTTGSWVNAWWLTFDTS